ncbi:crotonase/enoyl-CoA hydratase family protein [Sphingosinithalassobacter portus]|uniref:crotonase/enoyl-CoA hydratase family protein n=1 Tax=Stakelama portus TaxID=2676234 RepID=UPI000D6E532B|nr:crotonase/enoyl-CoA hydratase family protein [Sphingosinithalassobacter portus]
MAVLRIDWQGPVAHVVLDRPERLNALNNELIAALSETGRMLAGRSDCRAVILRGEGRGFCSGIDLDSLRSASGGGERAIDLDTIVADGANVAQHAVLVWQRLPMPVIAAVHGVALGGGFQLALGADIRIVAPDTRMAVMEAKWGLVPDMAGMALLRDLLRPDILAELIFTARMFDGTEALRLGLATQLSEAPQVAASDLAHRIAALSPDAIRAAKRLLRMRGTEAEILRAEAAEQSALFGTPNQREAVAAGMEKRPANFVDVPE